MNEEKKLLHWVAGQLPMLPHIGDQLRALGDRLEKEAAEKMKAAKSVAVKAGVAVVETVAEVVVAPAVGGE